MATRIAHVTDICIRKYSDSGAVRAYVEWIDTTGKAGRTEGAAIICLEHCFDVGDHMEALIRRGLREGVYAHGQTW